MSTDFTTSDGFDVVYSSDDEGWYAQEPTTWRTTAIFPDRRGALVAARSGRWENES